MALGKLMMIGLAALWAMPAAAQTIPGASGASSCLVGGMGFSPGATVRAGNAIMKCSPAYQWEPTEDRSGGCFFEGQFYSVGAAESGSEVGTGARCQSDGRWSPLPISE